MTLQAPVRGRRRTRVRVYGTVQGVGFRPYVYRLAGELGLAGFVLNDAHGVVAEVEGDGGAVDAFVARLAPGAPRLAAVEQVVCQARPVLGDAGFTIRDSPRGATPDAPVTPDSAVCDDCLRELSDPADRRHRYPFINCTNCGPRFTIVRGVPYDRPWTTMAGFVMCPACRAEYEDPADRRFHAQPNACPACGPRVSLVPARSERTGIDLGAGPEGDPVAAAADALRAGAIVAVKGVGGYHLACRADDEGAVAALRLRKHREDKPFALMAADVGDARRVVVLGEAEAALLRSPQRPIVLAPRRKDAAVAAAVAPGVPELGVMLPYSPLHHLLVADVGVPLVMTSGNLSDEPIAYQDDDARDRLAQVAELLLVHDRPIETRTDDSVVRVASVAGVAAPTLLRRSRGYVPAALTLGGDGTPRPLLACGAELKSTFCVAKGRRAWVSHHIGDLENYETWRSYTAGIAHFERLFAVTPEVVVHDTHPEYLSTKYALERDGVELIAVQHHHAHLAACLAEHGEADSARPALGAIFDGMGYGTDGTVWGGEFLLGDQRSCSRVGALVAVPLPGGAAAIRQPWRMACAWLWTALGEEPALPRSLAGAVSPRAWTQVGRLIQTGTASPMTTSVGRLCDAVAALCGVRAEVTYEGQAATELEAACDPTERGSYEMTIGESDGLAVLDPRPAIAAVAADVAAGVSVGSIAMRFHAGLARATVGMCAALAADRGIGSVVLAGGVFQNRRMLEAVSRGLVETGLQVLVPELLPVNDGGIAYGQAAVAAAILRSR